MIGTGKREHGAAEDRRKAAIEETAAWIKEQTEHVWHSLGVGDKEERELRRAVRDNETTYWFVYRGKVLAKARSYFSREERQWRFELTEADQERYEKVRAYFAGMRQGQAVGNSKAERLLRKHTKK